MPDSLQSVSLNLLEDSVPHSLSKKKVLFPQLRHRLNKIGKSFLGHFGVAPEENTVASGQEAESDTRADSDDRSVASYNTNFWHNHLQSNRSILLSLGFAELNLGSTAVTTTTERGDSESGISFLEELTHPVNTQSVKLRSGSVSRSIQSSHTGAPLTLPREILSLIFSFLSPSNLVQCMYVCKEWRAVAMNELLWKTIYMSQLGRQVPAQLTAANSGRALTQAWQKPTWRHLVLAKRLLGKRWESGNCERHTLLGHSDSVYCLQFNNNIIVTGSRDKRIIVWSAKTGNPIKLLDSRSSTLAHTGSVLCLTLDCTIMASGSSDGSCIVWDAKRFIALRKLQHHTSRVLGIDMSKNYIATCSKDSSIVVCDREAVISGSDDYITHRLAGHAGSTNAIHMHGDLLASAGGDGAICIWNIVTGKQEKRLIAHTRGVGCVMFTEDGRSVVSGGNDNVVKVWDLESGACTRVLRDHTALVRTLHVHGRRLVTGSYDKSVKVWDLDKSKLLLNLTGWHGSYVTSVKMNSHRLISASLDDQPIIFDFGFQLSEQLLHYLD
ncbi:hypothetical protein CANCADRAFT_1550 [Tortispora caseinolytica NRRL Y-17796]|uniref:F-box domain-containing protein n=1 Tax=Tortispora caseinolytica NRRL Y-17796 TaxID=767744 RepID=A0A1E4TMG3_9ASCO|nr:hypothetical protein CANCADRAFT_1550 [Tortispora caseinolytica NRRL Y-17796]